MSAQLDSAAQGVNTEPIRVVSERLSGMTPRFHLETERRPGAISWADLLTPEILRVQIDQHAVARNISDQQIAASLFVQGIATHVIGTTIAAEFVLGIPLRADDNDFWVVPGVPHMVWGIDALRSPSATVSSDASLEQRVQAWIDHWPAGHFAHLIEAVKSVVRVGRRMLEGNVASAVGNTLVFLDWWERTEHLRRVADALVAHPLISSHASLTDVTVQGRTGLRSNRSSCCLLLRVDGARACPSCPMVDDAERIDTTSMHVGHLLAVRPLA